MSGKRLRVAFMGTPDFSVAALRSLLASGHDVVCVYSQPPRPKGRGQQVSESPVHKAALEHGIEVRTPVNFKQPEDVAAFKALDLDVAVVAAYGLILPQSILDAPKYGCINIHASLLPRWRGAAPIHRAILAGDAASGITIMQMEAGLDTGPMISKKSIPILDTTTTQTLHDELSDLGAGMIVEIMDKLASDGVLASETQPEDGVTYAHMLKKEEGRIEWTRSAAEIDRQIRAFNPWPGTWCDTPDGKRLKIIEAGLSAMQGAAGFLHAGGVVTCGDGALALRTVQPENKKPMDVAAALNGGYLKAGQKLS